MTEISKTYNPSSVEKKWYQYWLDNKYFESKPNEKEPFTIVIPPPNVTGVLHMGHMLNNTIQDVLVRRARMQGKNACWVPGTDHASIATEAKVVQMLRERNIRKADLSRDEFLKYAWEWKEKYGGIILEQLKTLGASCDWSRTTFTMDPHYTESVINTFIDLHSKGFIYRGLRMVNWDPVGKTALSDEEVIRKETNSKLTYIRYQIDGTDEFITIATVRPETIMGDTAICVHPEDPRYAHLKGKFAIVPLINRRIPIIFDDYIDLEFGTGALKVTPAHDQNDNQLGAKHNLEVIDILNEDATLNENAQIYIGEDRFVVRKKIIKDLEAAGNLVKQEDYVNQVGHSERTDAVIEPRLSMQWFVDMKKFVGKNPQVLDAVMSDEIQFHPAKFKNTYKYWIDNVKDWCISRQLWWGQRIPAFYDPQGNVVVAKTAEEAVAQFKAQNADFAYTAADLKQDEDVVDTWFSSWLWPIVVFDGLNKPNNEEINYYYPTNDLVTAPEIMFFWVARMIMAGYEYKGELPFKNVYYTGIVRDQLGRKMSKSLGNSPDPLDLIEKYSADGVRVGMLLSSPAGNDLLFDESLCDQGKKFTNKIWNAFRLVESWKVDKSAEQSEASKSAIAWFWAKFSHELNIINEHYDNFRISDALMATYKLVWDDFCAWYLEMVKPEFVDGQPLPVDQQTYEATIKFFENILKVVHPFMPFISEEIWHLIKERNTEQAILIAQWPNVETTNYGILQDFEQAMELISQVRNVRKSKNIAPKEKLELFKTENGSKTKFKEVITKLCNLSVFEETTEKPAQAFSFVVKQDEFFVPLGNNIDEEAEKERIQKELDYLAGFLKSVQAKLGNEKFVQNAKPEMVEKERNKQADAEAKIKALNEQLASF